MDLHAARQHLDEQGYALLPGFFTAEELAPALAALPSQYPTAEEYHAGAARGGRFEESQFSGIERWPFADVELSLLAVHERLVDLAEAMLDAPEVRLYGAELWAKYTGAVDYDQDLHRDYLNHTFLVPSDDPAFRQLELFVYLVDVPEDLGPTHVVDRRLTAAMPAVPSFVGRGPQDGSPLFHRTGRPDLFEQEVSGAGPAGTVLVYTTDTFHRGTDLTRPGGARFTIHCNLRAASTEWAQRRAWVDVAPHEGWTAFVARATPRQLALFGWPPPGHPYWTPRTLAGVALRYPDLDLTPWR